MRSLSSAPNTCMQFRIRDPQSLLEPHSTALTQRSKRGQSPVPLKHRLRSLLLQKGMSRMKPELATLVILLLGTSLLTATGAPAVSRPPKALEYPSDCQLARFQSLSPQELQSFKRATNALEEMLQLKGWNCTGRLFPRKRDLRQLQVWERPMVLEAELALTLQVLEALTESSLGPVLAPPLRTLKLIQDKLQACMPPQPTRTPRPRGRLQHWLQRLHEAPQRESQSCLEASVTFNLFRMLIEDLRCVARGALCA